MENFDFCLIFLISKFFSSIDFFHMIFYLVVLPSLEFGIGHDLRFLSYSYTHIFFKFINKSKN